MSSRPFSEWTLRELFAAAEVLLRELAAHYQGDMLHCYQELRERLRPGREKGKIPLAALRALTGRVVDAQNFSNEIHQKLDGMLRAIDLKVQQEINHDAKG